jgi:hypothetical protein
MSTAPSDDIVRLATAENPVQAHILEQALRAEGIRCKVVGDYLDASFGDLPGMKPEIWVHREDVERAQVILHETDQSKPLDEGGESDAYDQEMN